MKLTIYRDVPVIVEEKCIHAHKICGRVRRSVCKSYGEVPVATFNEQTKRWEGVENHRGIAYGARRRMKYRKDKRHSNAKPIY